MKLEGAPNARDLGGYKTTDGHTVKPGILFRTDDLNRLSPSDTDIMAAVNLKTVVDFRGKAEAAEAPDRLPDTVTAIHSLSIEAAGLASLTNIHSTDNVATMCHVYRALVRVAVPQYTEFFRVLTDDASAPLLFHCSAGKDRTGFAAALILSALGVDRDTIFRDFLLSNERLGDKYLPLIQNAPHLEPLFVVRREYLQTAFDTIESDCGSVNNYLVGTLRADLTRLRELYLAS